MSDPFSQFSLGYLILTSLVLGTVAWIYVQRLKKATKIHETEIENQQKILKRHILELSVMRTLGERVGYSLDLSQILEVITESIPTLLEVSTVSYVLKGAENQLFFKTRLVMPVSELFLSEAKTQSLKAFAVMTGITYQEERVEEVVVGEPLEESVRAPLASFFNLPVTINGKVEALINVSSIEPGLYSDEETVLLYKIMDQVSAQMSKLSLVVEREKGKLSAMISSLADGVVMVDSHYSLIVANKAVLSLTGAVRIDNLMDLVAIIDGQANLQEAIKQALEHQNLVKLPEFGLANGKAVQIDVEPVKDKYNYLLGAVIVLHDVTAEKQLERMKEDFTAMMVHELRTPLTTIVYSTSMMMTDFAKLQPEDLQNQVKVISSTTSEMLSLVNELLDIAKIEAGKFQLVKKTEDLGAVLTEKMNQFKPLLEQKKLTGVLEIDPQIKPLDFDKIRIAQALDNLLSNAVKYTKAGTITLKAVKKDDTVLISITDTGEGISQADLPKLFSKFNQLGKGKSGEIGGTGLGLVISKGIVEAHGGHIWAESVGLGKGTTFTFSLPIK